jgi:type IV pilus assembly protein PilA
MAAEHRFLPKNLNLDGYQWSTVAALGKIIKHTQQINKWAIMKNTQRNQGFTLIELMIVIAIIAILIAYALPAYRDYSVRTKIMEGTAMAAAYKAAINNAYVRTGGINGLNNGAFGIGNANARGSCVNNIAVANGVINVTFDCAAGSEGQSDPNVDAATLTWSPTPDSSGTLNWACSAITVRPDQNPCNN